GNANNGNAAKFGPGNGTNPDVTETTGLEVVNPIDAANAAVAIPANNSAEVDPLIQYVFPPNKPDKPGKDNNYRGITEFGGALYFTKGSGSNGVQTVYTVDRLPTVANAASTTISIAPGFPTDSAKITGGNFTPFGVFFANATTMYVADEGSGNVTDQTQHAGLEKWSLVNGTWQLDYVLTKGLIGVVDANLTGADGQYPDVTTVGLRNLTGVVHGNGTVTLWATTSTSSASGDAGADPNKVVRITDILAATTMTGPVAQETFRTVLGPAYGTVYRGVAYAKSGSKSAVALNK
ncbi:MAG: type I phosphodiesterase/nucleotide pyrophosphatase, partial [Alphaproteobacteria bacterium]|nr:type I phosphodiesterase/nucleotide pyrophosphatase [Alphaproteobacteria bacterium]